MLSLASSVAAAPAPVGQDRRPRGDDAVSDPVLVDIGGNLSASGQVAGELSDLSAKVEAQLERVNEAEEAVQGAVSDLADADSALSEIEMQLEEVTERSDEVVIAAFVNPPTHQALDVLGAETMEDATIKHALLGMQADASADVLNQLEQVRDDLEERQEAQKAAHDKAQAARDEAEAALIDLQSGVSYQVQFVMQVEAGLGDRAVDLDELAKTDPQLAEQIRARESELTAALEKVQKDREHQRALEAIAEAERRAAEAGIWKCPVQGPHSFIDSWGYARSGGRRHQGTDMMASIGVPTVAPVSGRVEHRGNSLGGLSWYVYGDDGNTYYGTHLSSYANVGAGWVERGTLIGYVGDTGNAAGMPHLHFEYKPGGGASVNPYPKLRQVC